MAGETREHDTLILGVGNPLRGDDALGVLVVQQLQTKTDLPPHVTVIDGGTEGIGLIPVMETYRRVIVVDAVMMVDQPAGSIRRFTWDEIQLGSVGQPLSLHQSDLTATLLLADALDSLPPELVIYGVQPHNTEWDHPLSQAVARTLPILVEALIHEVRSDSYGQESSDH